jgi:hypothetical protein
VAQRPRRRGKGPWFDSQERLDEHSELQYLRASAASANSRRTNRREKKEPISARDLEAWVEERAGKLGRESEQTKTLRAEARAAEELRAKLDALARRYEKRGNG